MAPHPGLTSICLNANDYRELGGLPERDHPSGSVLLCLPDPDPGTTCDHTVHNQVCKRQRQSPIPSVSFHPWLLWWCLCVLCVAVSRQEVLSSCRVTSQRRRLAVLLFPCAVSLC